MDTRRRFLTVAAMLAALAGLAAAAILLNLTLLGNAQPNDDPVGNLSPRAVLPLATTGVTPTPPTVTAPVGDDGHGRGEHGGRDD